MARKKIYKTLKTLHRDFDNITMQGIVNGRMNHRSKGWINVYISDELEQKIIGQVTDLLGGWTATKEKVARTLEYHKPQFWGLERIMYCEHQNRFTYCAGQDYPREITTIRNFLK